MNPELEIARGQATPERPRDDSAEYLKGLGERVRAARARRGMTRKMLATQSGVSERYLAQLESGEGNASISLLRAIAHALDLQIEALISDAPPLSVDLLHAIEFLRRLPAAEIAQARQLLLARFAETDSTARHRRIALIGLRGAGKSTIGALLACDLDVPFLELDRMIEETSGLSLGAIFDLYGQAGFRRFERRCLDEVLERHAAFVLATGGSIVSEPATYDRLLTMCYTVWLRATPEEHMQRVIAQGDTRPMADNDEAMSDLRRILAGREPMYRKADLLVDTSGHRPEECVQDILKSDRISV
jgi:XRE family aerobic/anaerobic benzoate catabolism transcriptional regulator